MGRTAELQTPIPPAPDGGVPVRHRLACLHAHHANAAPLDGLFPPDAVEVVHYVDPGLVRRMAADPAFDAAARRGRVADQLAWIAAAGCDAIVVTCTAYSALAEPATGGSSVPVVTIDEPLFAALAAAPGPLAIAFTNPGTVEPTMGRLRAALGDRAEEAEPRLIPDAFDLFMAGQEAAYAERVAAGLVEIARSAGDGTVVAAQLSMAPAARRAADAAGIPILTPLEPLAARLTDALARLP